MAAVKVSKKELRQEFRTILQTLSHENVASQSKTAVSMLLSMQEYKESKKIGVYLSMPASEINTRVIVYDAFRHGKQVFVPYIYKQLHPKQGQPKSIMDMLELRSADEYESLNQDGWGIPTLSTGSVEFRLNCLGGTGLSKLGDEEVGENDGLDVLVMPGLVFDMHMGRVGHGKGFYDFFLQRYKDSHKDVPKKEMPLLVGLALSEQVLSSENKVPRNASDWLVDALITGHGRLLRSPTKEQVP